MIRILEKQGLMKKNSHLRGDSIDEESGGDGGPEGGSSTEGGGVRPLGSRRERPPENVQAGEKMMTTVFKMSEAWYQNLEVPHRALTYSILCEESPQSYVSIITRRGLLSDQLWIVLMKSLNFVYACQEVDINDVVRLARGKKRKLSF